MEKRRGGVTSPSVKRKGAETTTTTTTTGILRLDCKKPRRSSGSSVDFRGVPDKLSTQVEPPSPQPSADRLSVTFLERSDCSDSSVKVNVFDPGSPPSTIQDMDKVKLCRGRTASDADDNEEDDYSASVKVIKQRRESMRRASSKKKKRRSSSPLSGVDGEGGFLDGRRRSSVYTNSSVETGISIEEETTQEQIFENIRLHKEVLSNVKLQPWGMRRKIKLVQQAKEYVKRHEGELQERLAMSKSTKDILARFNIWLIKKLQYLRRELANTITLLVPWELRIKEIESHFGSAVASYFTFLRWMFWVNLVITIILACFVAIPEMLTADVKSAGERKEMLPEEKLTATNLGTLWDFEGVLKYSPIFYGYYTNKDGPGTGYRLPFAYFMTGLAVYVYSFVATLRRMAENSRMSKLSEKDDECIFTWKLFTGWDYMIGNAETAHNRVASLILGFKEALLEETERKKDEKNWRVICIRVLVNFLVVGLLVFSAYVVFIVVERSTEPEADDTWWRQNEITFSLSIISMIFPIFFELLGFLEGYHPRKSLRIQLARIMVLNLLNLYTLIFSQFWKISKMAIELQSLKANYSAIYGDTMSPTIESLPTNCYYVTVNCSAEASESQRMIAPTLAENITSGTVPVANATDFFEDVIIGQLANMTTELRFNASEEPTTLASTTASELLGILFGWSDPGNESNLTLVTDWNWSSTEVTTPEVNFGEAAVVRNASSAAPEAGASTVTDFAATAVPSACYEKRCDVTVGEETRGRPRGEMTGSLFDMETRKKLRRLCWETMFGQELVKLTVMDLVLTILSIMLLDFVRAVFVRVMNNCWCWDLEKKFPQYGDFKIAENILHLVNNQGMVWMGMFFSPGLPAINLIKLVIMMYLRSWAVLTCNVPHEVVFRASRSNNFYLALLLTMLFLCVLPVGFAIVWIEPSWHCGPFSDYKRIYHLFTESLQRALPETFHKALDYIASPGIIIPLLMLLVLIIYYLVSLTNSLREANNDLKIQLRRERTEERRKMFQLVDKRARKGSKDSETPFAKWKKLLPELSPRPPAPAPDPEKGEKVESSIALGDGKKCINRKELLTRLMKLALRKSSGTSDEESQMPEEVTDPEQPDSLFEEKVTKERKTRRSDSGRSRESRKKPGQRQKTGDEVKRPSQGTDRRKSPTSVKSTQRSSVASDWSENIPVIKISKTESEECILTEETTKPSEEEDDEEKRKGRFRETVEKQISRQIRQKEELGEQLERKAIEMQMEVKKVETTVEEVTEVVEIIERGHEVTDAETDGKADAEVAPASKDGGSATEGATPKTGQGEQCPIATEETVSSDLDLSQGSLRLETGREDVAK